MNDASPLEPLRAIAAILDQLGLPWCLGGSLASSFFGEPRATRDIDLIVELSLADIESLARNVEPRFYVSREAMKEAVTARRSFNIIDTESGFKLDLFVRGDSAFDVSEFSRREIVLIDPGARISVPIKSAEDSILRKLLWFQEGGSVSDQQWRDITGILAAQAGKLDEQYLTLWARQLGFEPLLSRAVSDARE